MSYQVLARKWRPRTFAELVGQEHVVRALSNALAAQRLHHAYLFTGTRGVGKTTTARILAKALNCETGITATPCGKCRACMDIDAGRFVDLLEVDAATNTRVEEMRELLDNAQYMPVAGRFKVYIIDEVHMLSKSAFNSMLKTLEEPPDYVKFILATTDPQKVPITVLSRCLQFSLRALGPAAIAAHLARVLEAEKVAFEPPALERLGHAARGSVRDALSLADQAIAYGGGEVTRVGVDGMLGTVGFEALYAIIDAVAANDGNALIAAADEIAARGTSFDAALEALAEALHWISVVQLVTDAAMPFGHDPARLAALAQRLSPEEVQTLYQIALIGRRDLPLAPDEELGFRMTCLRMLAFAPTASSNVARAPSEPMATTRQGTASVATPARAPASAPAASTAPLPAIEFDGDWVGLVARLGLSGTAGTLARHAELKSFSGRRIELALPEAHRHLTDAAFVERLKSALAGHFGGPVQLQIHVGRVGEATLAKREQAEFDARQQAAQGIIERDPVVRALVDEIGAKVLPDSIRPIG